MDRIISDLIKVATGELPHTYLELCPDTVDGHHQRDPECPACQAIMAAEAAIPVRPAAPAGRELTDEEIDVAFYESAGEFASPKEVRAIRNVIAADRAANGRGGA